MGEKTVPYVLAWAEKMDEKLARAEKLAWAMMLAGKVAWAEKVAWAGCDVKPKSLEFGCTCPLQDLVLWPVFKHLVQVIFFIPSRNSKRSRLLIRFPPPQLL